MRTAVVETSDYSQLPEHKNPVARKHARLFDGGYGEEIFPGQPTFRKEEAQLYIDDREWRVDLDFDPPKYEAYLQHLFWDRESLRRLIIVSGPVGCGKSTLLDFYLRSYCPTDPETAEEWKKKLTIAVDVKGIVSVDDFDYKFFRRARTHIIGKCHEQGFDIESKISQENDDRRWVESALEDISDKINNPKSEQDIPFQYLVLLIDNLDQSPVEVAERAVGIVKDWSESEAGIDLWRTFLPLWPSTLQKLRLRGKVPLPLNEVVPLGSLDYKGFLEARANSVSNGIEESGEIVEYEDTEGETKVMNNQQCVAYLNRTHGFAKRYPWFVDFVGKTVYGDLRRILDIWYGISASQIMFEVQKRGYHPPTRYELECAMLTGKYDVYNRFDTFIPNLFFMTNQSVSVRDLLIGPHILFLLLHRGLSSYQHIDSTLTGLGYSIDRVQQVWEKFHKWYNFFHVVSGEGENQEIDIHNSVVETYWGLFIEPAYLDEIAMVTPVDDEQRKQMRQTVCHDRDQFVARVRTTLAFIRQVRSDEEAFCCISELPSRTTTAAQFEERLESLQIPCLWKIMANSYRMRLTGLKDLRFLTTARGISEGWWEEILSDSLFTEAESAEDTLRCSS